jgi:hypothetical protein
MDDFCAGQVPMPARSTVTRQREATMTRHRPLFDPVALGVIAGLLLSWAPPALARAVSDYCRLFKKDDIEKVLDTHVSEVAPGPMKVTLGAEGRHDQACVFIAGSRVFRITIAQLASTDEARQLYKQSVSGQSIVNSADPKPLAGIRNEAVLVGSTVVMRRQNLVLDFSVRDFAADPGAGLSLARTVAAMVAERISGARSPRKSKRRRE